MQNTVDTSRILDVLKLIAPYITGGLAGAIFTLLARIVTDKRRRKQLRLDINKQRFSLPKQSPEGGLSSKELVVSYKGEGYANLALYTIKLENSGYGGITGQKIVIIFPKKTEILEELKRPSVSTIKMQDEITISDDAITKTFSFERLEKHDQVMMSFLLNCEAIELIQCKPRGVDDVDYVIGDSESKSEVQQDFNRLLLYASAFVLFGAIDIFGSILKAFTLFIAIPTILRLANTFLFQREQAKGEGYISSVRAERIEDSIIFIGDRNKAGFRKNLAEAD